MMQKQRKTHALLPGLLGLLLLTCIVPNYSQAPDGTRSKTYEFRNGRWFNGETFKGTIFYSLNGRLTTKRPPRIDEVVDLGGGFVVPPFGDAHCHHFDASYNVDQQIEMYL